MRRESAHKSILLVRIWVIHGANDSLVWLNGPIGSTKATRILSDKDDKSPQGIYNRRLPIRRLT